MSDISGVLLAGGQSRRLGTSKSFVEVGGVILIERVLATLRHLSDDIVIVTNDPEAYRHLEARLTGDIYPGKGSLGGIYSGLRAARHARSLIVATDMPFLSLPLLRYMIQLSEGCDVVIPAPDGRFEPLHAVYNQACLGPIADLLRTGNLRIIDFLGQVRTCYLDGAQVEACDPERLSFFNVNTPQDLVRAQELAARSG